MECGVRHGEVSSAAGRSSSSGLQVHGCMPCQGQHVWLYACLCWKLGRAASVCSYTLLGITGTHCRGRARRDGTCSAHCVQSSLLQQPH